MELVGGALVAGALVAGALVAPDTPSSVLLQPASAISAAVAARAILRRIVVLLNSASDTRVIVGKARPLIPVKAAAMPVTSVLENRHEPVGKSLHEVSADLLGMTHPRLRRCPERAGANRYHSTKGHMPGAGPG
jgi:hypothetical protein